MTDTYVTHVAATYSIMLEVTRLNRPTIEADMNKFVSRMPSTCKVRST